MNFYKYVSTGNDFVLLEHEECESAQLPEAARFMCSRRFGVGSDGLLVVGPGQVLRMFNPDGTEDFCGNGLACASLHAFSKGDAGDSFEWDHFGRRVAVRKTAEGFELGLGKADFRPDQVPVRSEQEWFDRPIPGWEFLKGSALSTGSAHLVVLRKRLPEDHEMQVWGPALERHALFPERINVMFAQVAEPNRLRLRIWERGAGETLGCGSGSVAAAAVWMRLRSSRGTVLVDNPGGRVVVRAERWSDPLFAEFRPSLTYRGRLCAGSPTPWGHKA